MHWSLVVVGAGARGVLDVVQPLLGVRSATAIADASAWQALLTSTSTVGLVLVTDADGFTGGLASLAASARGRFGALVLSCPRDEDEARADSTGLGFDACVPRSPGWERAVARVVTATTAPGAGLPREVAVRVLQRVIGILAESGFVRAALPRAGGMGALGSLSGREREVVQTLVAQRRVVRVARVLGISPFTVRNHLKSIFAKLDVHSQDELLDLLAAEEPT